MTAHRNGRSHTPGGTALTLIIKTRPGLVVTARAADGEQAIPSSVTQQQPDVVVVELHLPDDEVDPTARLDLLVDHPTAPKPLPTLAGPSGRAPGCALSSLSPREREVLVALATGRSNRQLAADLRVKESTVKTHVSRLLTKLALRSRTEAAAFAYQLGVVQQPDRPMLPARDS